MLQRPRAAVTLRAATWLLLYSFAAPSHILQQCMTRHLALRLTARSPTPPPHTLRVCVAETSQKRTTPASVSNATLTVSIPHTVYPTYCSTADTTEPSRPPPMPMQGPAKLERVASMYTSVHWLREGLVLRSASVQAAAADTCDLWSVAVTLYFLLFGRWPFSRAQISRWPHTAPADWTDDSHVSYDSTPLPPRPPPPSQPFNTHCNASGRTQSHRLKVSHTDRTHAKAPPACA